MPFVREQSGGTILAPNTYAYVNGTTSQSITAFTDNIAFGSSSLTNMMLIVRCTGKNTIKTNSSYTYGICLDLKTGNIVKIPYTGASDYTYTLPSDDVLIAYHFSESGHLVTVN